MTTINSLDEFLQALDDNPAWRDAVRARILGNELLQLPAPFNAFMEQQTMFNERVTIFMEHQQEFNERVTIFMERQQEFNERVTVFMERQQEFNERVTVFMERTEARMIRIESDISVTKGGHVRTLLGDLLPDLAETLGFDLIGPMPRQEIIQTARRISNATPRELSSFRQADLVVQVARGQETTHLAIEASWTADQRDSDRAVRNARFLAEATGLPAIPVIASVRNTREVTGLIQAGALRWYQLEERDVQAE